MRIVQLDRSGGALEMPKKPIVDLFPLMMDP